MAHFAQLDENNIVTNVNVLNDYDLIDKRASWDFLGIFTGNRTPEEVGDALCRWHHKNDNRRWVLTCRDTRLGKHRKGGVPFRKNYAGIGMIYDEERDAFYVPQPYKSWIFNEDTANWEPPIPRPQTGIYWWNEDKIKWDQD